MMRYLSTLIAFALATTVSAFSTAPATTKTSLVMLKSKSERFRGFLLLFRSLTRDIILRQRPSGFLGLYVVIQLVM